MGIPKLAVNHESPFPESYYQITNVSEDKQYYDFMGFKHISVNNPWAADIVRARRDMGYFEDLDYELTANALDFCDIESIAMGMLMTNERLFSTREETKPLDLDKLDKEEHDMTKEEIDEYISSVYKMSLDEIKEDKKILNCHEFITKEFEKYKKADIETKETLQPETIQEESVPEPVPEATAELTPQYINLLSNRAPEEIKQFFEKMYGSTEEEKNYKSMNKFFNVLFGEVFANNKDLFKKFVKETIQQLNYPPKNKKIYAGALAFIAKEISDRNIFNKKVFGNEINKALEQS